MTITFGVIVCGWVQQLLQQLPLLVGPTIGDYS